MLERLDTVSASIPITPTEPRQLRFDEWDNQLFVKATASTHELTGWGEITTAVSKEPYIALINEMKPNLLHRDESRIIDLWNAMRRITFRAGYGVTSGAISGIDIALWDIVGKSSKKSVSELLGSESKNIRRYVSLSRYKSTHDVCRVVGGLLDSGYESIKVNQPPKETQEAVATIRKEFGDGFDLMVDLHCGLDFRAAQSFVKDVQRYELKWIEEPLWPPDDIQGLKELNKLGPIAAGENFFSIQEFRRLMDSEALSYYQPDVTKMGGITPMVDLMTLFRVRGAHVAFHNRPHNGWIGIIASTHVACLLDCIIETPPNGVPEQFFSFKGSVGKHALHAAGPGLGIEFLEPSDKSGNMEALSQMKID